MVDKNLFLHDLAVVAIMKCAGPYLKEWLDYHLLAGVDHFYIYDNESPDNQAEVAKPYVEAGLVDYIYFPGKAMQSSAYNDALKKFRFHCRYMAFIDDDEFIYPKVAKVNGGGYSIVEIVDEVLSHEKKASGLAIHWLMFDANGHEKADYSRGVLERFTRCMKSINSVIKTIADPRKTNYFTPTGVHLPKFFAGFFCVDEQLNVVKVHQPTPATAEKIVINHYKCKSLEEWIDKIKRGDAVFADREVRKLEHFHAGQLKDGVFCDDILKYRDAQKKIYQPHDDAHTVERLMNALKTNLLPTLSLDTPPGFYEEKVETFLTCRAVAAYLKEKLTDNTQAKFLEETSIIAVLKSIDQMILTEPKFYLTDIQLLIREFPKIISLTYPVVEKLKNTLAQYLYKIKDKSHIKFILNDPVDLEHYQAVLKFRE